jgi:hypothetical protein
MLVLAGVMSGTASASVSSLTLDSKAQLSSSKTSAVATGTIVCTAGDSVDVTVAILQSSGKVSALSQGDATITCSGQVQAWAVTTNVITGSGLKDGPANAVSTAFDSTDGTSFPVQAQGIHLG